MVGILGRGIGKADPGAHPRPRKAGPIGRSVKLHGAYDTAQAVVVLDRLAAGDTITDIARDPEMPSRKTIYKWITVHPEFERLFATAKELSALSFEEKALAIADKLKDPPESLTGTEVAAYRAAMEQFRWSAARRDPARYGQQTATIAVVPIQINTTLDMGKGADTRNTQEFPDIYRIEAKITPTDGDKDP